MSWQSCWTPWQGWKVSFQMEHFCIGVPKIVVQVPFYICNVYAIAFGRILLSSLKYFQFCEKTNFCEFLVFAKSLLLCFSQV